MLVAAAVCPNPPLLVPRVAGGFAPDLDACRDAATAAIDEMLNSAPDVLVLVGGGACTYVHDPAAVGSLRPYGVELTLGPPGGPCTLPLSLGIARWLLADRRTPALRLQEVDAAASSADCAAVGAVLTTQAPRVAMLVAADGSAYASQTPVGDDGRGDRYNDAIAAALEHGDGKGLGALDPADDVPLWVAGRAALQVLGGALTSAGGSWRGQLTWRGAPYGVGYFVAGLRPA